MRKLDAVRFCAHLHVRASGWVNLNDNSPTHTAKVTAMMRYRYFVLFQILWYFVPLSNHMVWPRYIYKNLFTLALAYLHALIRLSGNATAPLLKQTDAMRLA